MMLVGFRNQDKDDARIVGYIEDGINREVLFNLPSTTVQKITNLLNLRLIESVKINE